MAESRNSLGALLAKILVFLGFFTTLIASIKEFQTLTADPQGLRVASLAGFILTFLSSVWLAFKAKSVRQTWRWSILVLLYIITILFSLWVGTWIGASRPLFVDKMVFPIEEASVASYLYEGVKKPEGGQGSGYLTVTSTVSEGEFRTSYRLEYDLPQDGDAYAGVVLWFPEPRDLTGYNFIELTISFGDDQARCTLFIKDSFGGKNSVILGDGDIVRAKVEEQTIQIPLKTYFPSVARKSVREIDLDVNSLVVTGKHSFTVSRIQFRK